MSPQLAPEYLKIGNTYIKDISYRESPQYLLTNTIFLPNMCPVRSPYTSTFSRVCNSVLRLLRLFPCLTTSNTLAGPGYRVGGSRLVPLWSSAPARHHPLAQVTAVFLWRNQHVAVSLYAPPFTISVFFLLRGTHAIALIISTFFCGGSSSKELSIHTSPEKTTFREDQSRKSTNKPVCSPGN